MAVEFVVEDGTKVDNSNSYCTVDFFTQYWENRGTDYSSLTDAQVQVLLISATQKVDEYLFRGYAYTTTQSLLWPRAEMVNKKGYPVQVNEIPTEVKNAVCEIAGYIQENGNPDNFDTNVKSQSIGPVSVEYWSSNTSIEVKTATRWLSPFILHQVRPIRQ